MICRSYEQITAGSTAQSLADVGVEIDERINYVLFTFEGPGPVRYRGDGGVPTADVGVPYYEGGQRMVSAAEARASQFYAAADTVVNVELLNTGGSR
ncbi:hypothetical protein [Ruficoccus sp. ZRK36]|uniref:hypothetical protein n=1 Tax=Ruficoccus sp. ZRK36 TaxID=2866311 RepID=UPI001C737AE4|nr:hypothetical protein [Ruficoccus sp. ZRK36]QYY35313.1 hypothetical protein K0V07_13555 [Ruficoccus sp. ZRK36]